VPHVGHDALLTLQDFECHDHSCPNPGRRLSLRPV
jgi:hypothetical protein